MEIRFGDQQTSEFDPELYVKILIAIAKADPNNGRPEFAFIGRQSLALGVDFGHWVKRIDKGFAIETTKVSRATALAVLRDCIHLASMDRNFTLAEKERVYTYAAKLDVPRSDLDHLERWVADCRTLESRWEALIGDDSHP
ncbi:MAG: hypothetical protein QNJ22_01245 [Desulfosarcinaceae bacterium]|nr:hypothetical protein [Desulfosarcinaceae bacterium]